MFENPFAAPGAWYRANLHAHTTASDGDISPAESADLYRRAGYQVLAVTDHWHVTQLPREHADFLVLSGCELHSGRGAQGRDFHIVGLNVPWQGKVEWPAESAQRTLDQIREAGGSPYIAHPYWSGLMAPDLAAVEGAFAVEVYNTGCDVSIARGYSAVQWDDLLTLGHDFGALAVDDGHQHKRDHTKGWTLIRAEELSVEAIMDALRKGRYYASTGPEILDVKIDGEQVSVATSPAASIALVSQPCWGRRVYAQGDEPLTRAEFTLPKCRYYRIEVLDRNGKMAWTNPFLRPEYNDSLGKTPWG